MKKVRLPALQAPGAAPWQKCRPSTLLVAEVFRYTEPASPMSVTTLVTTRIYTCGVTAFSPCSFVVALLFWPNSSHSKVKAHLTCDLEAFSVLTLSLLGQATAPLYKGAEV